MTDDFAHGPSGIPAGEDEGGGPQELSIAEEFWLAMGRKDRTAAEEIVAQLDVPPVVGSAYSFEMIEEDEGEPSADSGAPQGEDTGASTPRGVTVMPDTPTEAVNAWNRKKPVRLMLVMKSGICGAWVGNGEVDFLACGKAVDREGGSSCGMTTHQTGGKDSKKQNVLKISLPQEGGVFVIPVAPSNSSVTSPKIFSSPVLTQARLLYDKGWDAMLTTLALRAREWKYLIEAYPGEPWIVNTCLEQGVWTQERVSSRPRVDIPPPAGQEVGLEDDSHMMDSDHQGEGRGPSSASSGQGLRAIFEARGLRPLSQDVPPRGGGSVRSNVSGDSDHQSQQSTPLYTRLAPLYQRVQSLETKVGGLQVTIPKSFDSV
jgi:hypothetical protein